MPLEAGQRLGAFEILSPLGKGGMGEVYRARDTTLGRQVAVKILPEEMAQRPDRAARFEREAKLLAALDHPHIAGVHGLHEQHGARFLVMELVEGQTLAERLARGPIPVPETLDVARQIAEALEAAHEKGIIHRDLKPSNVMLTSKGRVKVLDFGLARFAEQAEVPSSIETETAALETGIGVVLGTAPYMSPEQARGDDVDTRTDVWSFGCVVFEMLTGSRPFPGRTRSDTIAAILVHEPPWQLIPEAAGPVVESLLRQCLSKERGQRLRDGAAARIGIDEVTRGALSGASSVTGAGEQRLLGALRPASRKLLTVGAALTILGLGLATQRLLTPPAGAIRSIAVLPLQNLTGDEGQEYVADGLTEALITDLSKIGALKVISRSSTMRYKEASEGISEIARSLGVDGIVEGSVMREGSRIAVSARLIEAATTQTRWADRFERDMTSVFALQGDIAKAIAEEIRITLTPAEQELLSGRRDADPAAHEAYLRGVFHLRKFTPQDFEIALQHFDTAIEIDPGYARAHAGIASAWIYVNQLGTLPPTQTIPRVLPALEKALELDPDLAEAHLVRAQVAIVWDLDWERADAAFRRAIELNPSFADAHIFYSHFLTVMGRAEEGTAAAREALELDPLNPFYHGLFGIQIGLTGQYEEAVAQLRRSHEMAPGFDFGRTALAYLLGHIGREGEALTELRTFYGNVGDRESLEAMEEGERRAGYHGAMKAAADVLERRSEEGWVSLLELWWLYDQAGEPGQAVEWMLRGDELRAPNRLYLGAIWLSEELRGDPKYRAFLERLGLEDLSAKRG